MHFAFMPVGKRSEVEIFFRDLEAQKHYLRFWKGEDEKKIAIQGQLRILPFGVCEYVFPKEDMDCVLHTMINETNRYGVSKFMLKFISHFLKLKPIPEYKKDKSYLWVKENVNVIPLGIREDLELTEPEKTLYSGYTHEAL